MMKQIHRLLITVFLSGILLPGSARAADEAKIAVLNPRGVAPPIRLVPMAPRLDTIDGKTIYIVNIGFGDTFLPEMQRSPRRYPS